MSYGALVDGAEFNRPLSVSVRALVSMCRGQVSRKIPSYTVVGQPIPRADIAHKVLRDFSYVVDFRLPGMLHGRVVRPTTVGAKLVSVDESSVNGISGSKSSCQRKFCRRCRRHGMGRHTRHQSAQGNWSAAAPAFPEQDKLYAEMRSAAPKASKIKLIRATLLPP